MYWEYYYSLRCSEQEERNWLKVHCSITFTCTVFHHRFLLGKIIANTDFYSIICGPLDSQDTRLTLDSVTKSLSLSIYLLSTVTALKYLPEESEVEYFLRAICLSFSNLFDLKHTEENIGKYNGNQKIFKLCPQILEAVFCYFPCLKSIIKRMRLKLKHFVRLGYITSNQVA